MKTMVCSLVVTGFLLSGGFATAGSWVDSYWPLHDGDAKSFIDSGANSYTLNVYAYSPGEFELNYFSPGYSESDFFQQSSTAILLDKMSSADAGMDIYLEPGIIIVNDAMLQNGGAVSSATTVSLLGYAIAATFTSTISSAGTVMVPAGSFANCRNIVVKMSVPGQGSTTIFTAVLTPEVGIIKELLEDGIWAQLVSGKVGGMDVTILAAGAPVVRIKTPANAQRIDTATNTVTITGSVSGYAPGLKVFYQINADPWASAVVLGTNWSGSAQALTGTNVLRAYALDAVGRTSPVVVVKFQYVVMGLLTVQAVGSGTTSPNYSNAWLELGRSYSITATPATGYVCTNWVGQVNSNVVLTTNKPVLTFIMASNLELTVTFVDVAKPVLTIAAPVAGQRWSNAQFTVACQVADNGPLGEVDYQLNGGGWTAAQMANTWSNWTMSVTLVPGTNVVRAYAMDVAGNRSLTNSVSLDFVVTSRLEISAKGRGTLSPNYSNAWLEIGRNYTITATPERNGFVFAGWTTSTNWLGAGTNTSRVISFMMTPGLTLSASFLDTNKPKLTITAPTAGKKMTNALANLTGTASDNWKVIGVWYQLNGRPWLPVTTANNYSNWTATATLVAGTNTLRAYALDLGGNYSPTNTLSVVSSNTFKLQLAFPDLLPMKADGLVFNLQLSRGLNGRIQVSSNLTSWVTLTNFVGTNTTINFRDPAATNFIHRFYRAVIP